MRRAAPVDKYGTVAAFYAGLTALGVPIFTAPPAGDDYHRPVGWQHLTPGGNEARIAARAPGDAIMGGCGENVVVADIDPRNGGDVDQVQGVLHGLGVRTFADIETGGSGRHFYVAGHPDIATTHSLVGMPGVDILSAGANVFLPGTVRRKHGGRGYTILVDNLAELADGGDPDGAEALAGWIIQHRAVPPAELFEPVAPWNGRAPDKRQKAYLTAAVERQAAELAAVSTGGRNDALNIAAVKLGNYVAGAGLDQGVVVEALTAAATANGLLGDDGAGSVAATIRSGLRCGKQRPRAVPPATTTPPAAPLSTHGTRPAPSGPRKHWRMAYRLADEHDGRLLHVIGIGWHRWDGRRWAVDDGDVHATRAVADTIRTAWAEAATLPAGDERKAFHADIGMCETASGTRGVLDLTKVVDPITATVDHMDADPFLLNTATGTVDLRTGERYPHNPADKLTRVTVGGYDPQAPAPVFTAFLQRVLPDDEVRRFMQRLTGAALLGVVREHSLPILTGTGQNGKTTLVEAVGHALGGYYLAAPPGLLTESHHQAHPTELMTLLGKRLVTVIETDQGAAMSVERMKRLTGGDTISARLLYRNYVEFAPSHSPVMITNHLPQVPGDDPAVWRRLLVVPFDVVIDDDEKDGELRERLQLEADGILSWAVAGYADYAARGGLDPPAAVKARTEAYQVSSDLLGIFIDDVCVLEPGNDAVWALQATVWEAWQAWCRNQGKLAGRQKDLVAALTERFGVRRIKTERGQTLRGLAVTS